MISEGDYTAGWFDSSIHEFLKEFARPLAGMRFALITTLDSCPDLPRMMRESKHLRPLASEGRLLGRGLLVPAKRLLEVDRDGPLFFGYDEVWFFPKPPTEPKPDPVSLVGPTRLDPEGLRRAVPWMSRTSCSLGLGDGNGLNFTAKVQGLARYLVAHSVSQPVAHD